MTLFDRSIEIHVLEEGNDLRIEGSLKDARFGQDLHWIEVRMVVSLLDGEIREISGEMREIPMKECEKGLLVLGELKGEKIRPGFTEVVRNTIGSNMGCTHLATLVTNMGNVSVQGRGAYIRRYLEDGEMAFSAMNEVASDLGLKDSCVCWTEDGPILRRWREAGGGQDGG